MYTDNQINDAFTSLLNRPATPDEVKKYATASPQTIANLPVTYSKLNTNSSISDYLTSIGQDNSLQARTKLGQQYGIANVGTAEGNTALLNAMKSGKKPAVAPVAGSVAQALPQTPQQPQSNQQPQQPQQPQVQVADAGLGGSVAGAASQDTQTPQTPTVQTVDTDPYVQQSKSAENDAYGVYQTALQAYQGAQTQVKSIDDQVSSLRASISQALQDKEAQAAASGGVVSRSQIAAEVAGQTAPVQQRIQELLQERATYASSQSQASQNLQQAKDSWNKATTDRKDAESNYYKTISANQAQQKIDTQASQFNTKTDIQQSQFSQKEQDVANKLVQSGYKKIADYQDGTKVGEHYINLSGKNVAVNSDGSETVIGTGSSVGSSGSGISSSAGDVSSGKIEYTDFAGNPYAPTDENRNDIYKQTGKTYGAVFEDAIAYAETGKYQKTGMGSKPSIIAYDAAVKAKASNIAAALGMTEADLRTAYAGNKSAIAKLITLKSTTAAFENKAKAQIDMILNGYSDPTTGKEVAPLNSSVSRTDWPLVNSAFIKGKLLTGDTPTQLLSNSLITFSNEYAKIMSGSTGSSAGSSDSARNEAQSLISTSLSEGTLASTLGLLQKEMDTTIEGYDKQIQDTGINLTFKDNASQSGFRTDRNNNPIAASMSTNSSGNQYTKALDAAGIPWVKGDTFPGDSSMSTIRIIGDPNEAARAILSNSTSIQDWYLNHTGKDVLAQYGIKNSADFKKADKGTQDAIIQGIYKNENGSSGGSLLNNKASQQGSNQYTTGQSYTVNGKQYKYLGNDQFEAI